MGLVLFCLLRISNERSSCYIIFSTETSQGFCVIPLAWSQAGIKHLCFYVS